MKKKKANGDEDDRPVKDRASRTGEFSRRIVLVSLLAFSCTVILSVLNSARYFSTIIGRQIIASQINSLESLAVHTGRLQENILHLARLISSDMDLQILLSQIKVQKKGDALSSLIAVSKLRTILQHYRLMENSVISIELITSEDAVFDCYANSIKQVDELFGRMKKYRTLAVLSNNNNGYLGPYHMQIENGRYATLVYFSRINSMITYEREQAFLFLYIDVSYFTQGLRSANIPGLTLFSGDGSVIFSNKAETGTILIWEQLRKEISTGKSPVVDHNILGFPLPDNWIIAMDIPHDIINAEVFLIARYFTISFLIALIVFAFIAVPLQYSITRPVRVLSMAARELARGNFSARVEIHGGDELQKLGEIFNEMAESLQRQMDTIRRREQEKSRLEQDLLIAQINPHFIYNTLNSFIYLLKAKRYDDSGHLCRLFLGLLQSQLKTGFLGMVNLSSELRTVKQYCAIQQYRYPERFEIEYRIDPLLLEEHVPFMFLQPLVENALFHGILADETPGKIIIEAVTDTLDFTISVMDNGAGIQEDMAQSLLHADSLMHSIGFFNIKKRLDIMYGEKYHMDIKSPPPHFKMGTAVVIRFPRSFKPAIMG
jgi:two-component system sensor histidine kinase YesM